MNRMAQNDYIEIFVFKLNKVLYKVKLNHTQKSYSLYASNGRLIFRMENISNLNKAVLQKELAKWLRETEGFKFW